MRKQELHPCTAVLNKAQKNQSKKARMEALLWLAATFPAAFDNTVRIRPLKAGIMVDILQHADKAAEAGISKAKLREAVVLFTRRLDYLTCLKAQEARIDLHGTIVCEVTHEEAESAAAKIKKRVEKSIKNARKLITEKSEHYSYSRNPNPKTSQNTSSGEPHFPTYPSRSSAYNSATTPTPPRAAAVIVKHKTTRQFDPDAVARLKERLGLSLNTEDKKETAE